MNVASYVTTFFIVVISMLGFTSVYSQIEAGTRQRVAHMRMLARVQAVYPLLIYICLMLILLRYLYGHSSNLMLFWAFVNIQSTILIYSNLLTTSLVGFAIIQTVGAITYISTGAMSITNWILFLFACLVIYAERWYGQLLHQQRWVYFLPALFVGTLFWVNMYLTAPRPLPLGLAIANLISFGWAYFASGTLTSTCSMTNKCWPSSPTRPNMTPSPVRATGQPFAMISTVNLPTRTGNRWRWSRLTWTTSKALMILTAT